MATISGSYPPVTLQDIEALESRKQLSLPDNYKAFLLRSNGGRPEPAGFEVPGWPGRASSVSDFYGIHPGETCDLDFWIEEHSDRLPAGFITIGNDPGANALCMSTSGKNRGKIYYWDSSPDWDIPPESPNMYLIAENIDDFLQNLKDPDDLPPPDLSLRLWPPSPSEAAVKPWPEGIEKRLAELIQRSLQTARITEAPVEVVKVVSDAYRDLGLPIRCSEASVRPENWIEQCPSLADELRQELGVEEVALVAWNPDINEFIRNAFYPIEVKKVFIEYDPLFEQEVAKVVISEDDLEEADVRMRTAAMLTQQDLELVLENELDRK